MMDANEQAIFVAAVMRASGATEMRIPDEALAAPSAKVVHYRDDLRAETVFRLVIKPDVIDGEEVPMPTAAIEAARS